MGSQEDSEEDRLALGDGDPTSDLGEEDEDAGVGSIEQLQLEQVEARKRTQCPVVSTSAIAGLLVLNVVSVVLTIDQRHGTHSWKMPFDLQPRTRIHRSLNDMDMRPDGGGQNGGTGSWPDRNDKARLSACAVSVVTLTFLLLLILCKSGRRAQVVVLLVLQIAAGLHVLAFLLDNAALSEGKTQAHKWADIQGLRLDSRRYLATVCGDAFNSFSTFMFSALNLVLLLWLDARRLCKPPSYMEGRGDGQ